MEQTILLPEKQQEKIMALEIEDEDKETVKGNLFAVTAIAAKSTAEVDLYLHKLRQEYSESTHIAVAFSLDGGLDGIGYFDDGEHGAGRTLLESIFNAKKTGVALYLRRSFAAKIGPERFRVISRLAKKSLSRLSGKPRT